MEKIANLEQVIQAQQDQITLGNIKAKEGIELQVEWLEAVKDKIGSQAVRCMKIEKLTPFTGRRKDLHSFLAQIEINL